MDCLGSILVTFDPTPEERQAFRDLTGRELNADGMSTGEVGFIMIIWTLIIVAVTYLSLDAMGVLNHAC